MTFSCSRCNHVFCDHLIMHVVIFVRFIKIIMFVISVIQLHH